MQKKNVKIFLYVCDRNMEYVYFIFDTIHYKIGRSNSPVDRLVELQVGNSRKLTLYKVISTNCSIELENYFHKILKEFNIRGEWFNLTCEQIDRTINDMNSSKFDINIVDLNEIKRKTQKFVCRFCEKTYSSRKSIWRHLNNKKTSCLPRQKGIELYNENIRLKKCEYYHRTKYKILKQHNQDLKQLFLLL